MSNKSAPLASPSVTQKPTSGRGRPPTALERLLKATIELRKVYPRMELGQLMIFLTIVENPGISQFGLLAELAPEITKSGLSKGLKVLAGEIDPDTTGRKTNLRLIERTKDGRTSTYAPSQEGLDLMTRVNRLLKG